MALQWRQGLSLISNLPYSFASELFSLLNTGWWWVGFTFTLLPWEAPELDSSLSHSVVSLSCWVDSLDWIQNSALLVFVQDRHEPKPLLESVTGSKLALLWFFIICKESQAPSLPTRRLLEISLLSNNNTERNQQVRHIFGYYNLILTKGSLWCGSLLLPFAKPPLSPSFTKCCSWLHFPVPYPNS